MTNQSQANGTIQLLLPSTANKDIYYSQSSYGDGVLFPWKLHDMLEAAEDLEFTTVVSWLPDGKTFRVHDKERFVNHIMQRYFDQTKYKSFQRQLNMWGFRRPLSGPEKNGYSHQHFVRGRPSLCCRMQRTKKSTKSKAAGASPETKKKTAPLANVNATSGIKVDQSNEKTSLVKECVPVSVVSIPSTSVSSLVSSKTARKGASSIVSHDTYDLDYSDRSDGRDKRFQYIQGKSNLTDEVEIIGALPFSLNENTNCSTVKRNSIISLGEDFNGQHFCPLVLSNLDFW